MQHQFTAHFLLLYFRIIGGFEDKNGVREFLFALPRFAVDKVHYRNYYH